MFAGTFAPRGWALCDGQLLSTSQNDALFSLYGTIYGGDGRTTFGLPDLRGRVPVHAGSGSGLSQRKLGAKGGSEKVTLTANQLTAHTHTLNASTQTATDTIPTGKVTSEPSVTLYYDPGVPPPLQNMSPSAVTQLGGSRSHTNLAPYLCINFIVALFGIYPSRN
jgi:microcystin-dependent protein